MCEDHVARITLDVIDAVALPATSPAEVEDAVAGWRFINRSSIDLRRALMAADLTATDLVVVELTTRGASLPDVWGAFAVAQLAPCGLVEAIRLVATTEPARWRAFPFLCLGLIASKTPPKAPVVDCAAADTVVVTETALRDNENQPALGWSDHSFALARHASSTRVR